MYCRCRSSDAHTVPSSVVLDTGIHTQYGCLLPPPVQPGLQCDNSFNDASSILTGYYTSARSSVFQPARSLGTL